MSEQTSISTALERSIRRAQADWQRMNQLFRDTKSAEFESRYFFPMVSNAQFNVEWLRSMETELDRALQFCRQPIP